MAQFKDDEFYMTLVTLQVEDRLFRVPRRILEAQCPVFKDMFSFPPPLDAEAEGSSDEHPIVLPEPVKVEDFKRLLKVLLPTSYYGTRLPKDDHDGWISVLKLSKMWQIDELHCAALKNLKYSAVQKSAVEKLALALKYEINDWIIAGVNELARRSEPINVEDARTLGLETVEDCLFRVPRQTLEAQSPVFRNMFSMPPPPDVEVEGLSDEHPIVLPEPVKARDFKRLLKVLLPTGPRLPKGDHDAWISVLKLSRMWEMEEPYSLALRNLKYPTGWKSAVEKLALALEHEITDWIVPGVNELARRQEPISVEDTQILGLETALKVAAVRESLVTDGFRLTAGCRTAANVDFTPIIKEIF
ncbi:hypothetical protein EDD17DRAFT_1812868, partial [Pisolithus thermaeus]